MKRSIHILILIASFALTSCAYFNTFYNARESYNEALKEKSALKDDKMAYGLRKKFDKAIEKCNKTLVSYPDSKYADDALFIIALSYYHKDEFKRAKKIFEDFINQYPQSELLPELKIWYGRNLWKLGEEALALRQLKKTARTLENKDLKAQAQLAIAEIFQEKKNLDSALFYLGKVTESSRKGSIAAETQFKIAQIYLLKNDPQQAVVNLKKVSRFSPTPELKNKMQVLLARIYREAKDYDAAQELIFAKLGDEGNKGIWGQLELELGLVYLAKKDYESAISRFTQITENYKKKPESAEAYYYLAQLNMTHFHNYEKAQEHFNNVIREDAKSRFAFESKQKASEIKRFFSVQKDLEKSSQKALAILEELAAVPDTSMARPEGEESPDSMQVATPQAPPATGTAVDTLAIFENYYRAKYEVSELYYFNFEQRDSAVNIFQAILNSPQYNPYVDKTIYALYYIHNLEQDAEKANRYKIMLEEQYPESPYLSYINHNEILLPTREREAEDLYLQAEPYFYSDPDTAIRFLTDISVGYPKAIYGEKSAYCIGWLYQTKLYQMQPAIDQYKAFMNDYPKSGYYSDAQRAMNFLTSIQAEQARLAEEAAAPVPESIPPAAPADAPDQEIKVETPELPKVIPVAVDSTLQKNETVIPEVKEEPVELPKRVVPANRKDEREIPVPRPKTAPTDSVSSKLTIE